MQLCRQGAFAFSISHLVSKSAEPSGSFQQLCQQRLTGRFQLVVGLTFSPSPSWNFRIQGGLSRRAGSGGVAASAVLFQFKGELSMKKAILVGLAILAVSTSGALAKKASKPKAPAAAPAAAATTTAAVAPFMMGQVSAKDREMYEKNQRESGMKKK